MKTPENMNKKLGVYKITCANTSDTYIGSTKMVFTKRWSVHKSNLKKGIHRNKLLQALYNLYGPKSFIYEVIESISNNEDLISREQYYIDTLNPTLNIFKYAGSSKGRVLSEEHKKKIGNAQKGKILSDMNLDRLKKTQFVKGHVSWNKGKKLSNEARQKISETRKGKPNSKLGKRVEYKGIVYESLSAASRSIGVSKTSIHYKIKKGVDFKYI